ncbi:uncharacterized protein VTP21DRAFT_421 [Calcarisporiella thermophila]|uniref:uncharacterized protein n=1 Tax=Calcarisporiella thermophila TaxID=911321 RepID=UPI003742FAB7
MASTSARLKGILIFLFALLCFNLAFVNGEDEAKSNSPTKLGVSEVKVAVVGSDKLRKDGENIVYPNPLPRSLTLDTDDSLVISLKILNTATNKGIQPHQAIAIFSQKETGEQISRVLQVRESGRARLELPTGDAIDSPGAYNVELVLGTFDAPLPLIYKIGTVVLPGSSKSERSTRTVYGVKPEITHTFRQPEKTAPEWVNKAFVLIVLSPWLLLIIGWVAIGITPSYLSPLFSSTSTLIYSVAFFATLLSIEYLLYLYWVRLNIFQAIAGLSVLGLGAFVTGQRALTEIQVRREKFSGKYGKKE